MRRVCPRAAICHLAALTRASVQLHKEPTSVFGCICFQHCVLSTASVASLDKVLAWFMLAWRVQKAVGAVASRRGTRLAHIRAMATLQGSSSAVEQGMHKLNDTDFISYRYTAPTAADKPCVVFLHGKHA